MLDLHTSRIQILTEAAESREREVLGYQIDIDNYHRAIVEADKDRDMVEFAQRLRELLLSSIIEQKKAKIMLKVITDQLEDGDAAGKNS